MLEIIIIMKRTVRRCMLLLKEHGSIKDAIRNAKRLTETYEDRQDYTEHNPCTMVWMLVEELM